MRLRLTTAALALVALGIAAGCGGGGGAKPSSAATAGGAGVAPKGTPFFVQLDTDFAGAQWQALDALLEKFPDGTKLFSSIVGKGLDFERDVKPALGPELDLLAMSLADLDKSVLVGLTQPKDKATFDTLISKDEDHPVTEEIEGWQAVADERATIDRFKEARNDGVLSADDAYRDASAGLPVDALARIYVDGGVLTEAIRKQAESEQEGPVPGVGRVSWLAGAVTAQENGLGLDLRLKGDEIEAKPFASQLVSQAPADVLVYLGFGGLDEALEEVRRTPAVEKLLGPAQKLIGGTLDDLVSLFGNEGALYVRAGSPIPEITLVLSVDDEQAALATLDKLAGLSVALTKKLPEEMTIAGVSAKKVAIGKSFALTYAAFDGKLVLTTQESGIEGLRGGGERLAGSQGFKDAAEAAGMPDETAGFLYANVHGALPLLDALTKKKPINPEVRRNLEPLGTALLYGDVDGDVASVKGFVSVP